MLQLLLYYVGVLLKTAYLAEALYEPNDDQTEHAVLGCYRNEETKEGVDEHSPGEEVHRAVPLGQDPAGDLSEAVAVEEGREDVTLLSSRPDVGTILLPLQAHMERHRCKYAIILQDNIVASA